MLNRLIEDFDSVFPAGADRSAVQGCLAEEAAALMNPDYLVSTVIGQGEFDWDFNSLGEGFIKLVGPFMAEPSWTSVLFLQALREFDGDASRHLRAIVFLEYAYYSSLINDFYNFNALFTESEPDRWACSRLTQLRYAGQYLSKYPAYLLINNTFGVNEDVQSAIHQWLANVYVTLGIGRGVLMKWSHRLYESVTLEAYLQNSINGLCLYVIFPVVLAAIFAGIPESDRRRLKEALNHLTLAVKLGLEQRLYGSAIEPDVPRELSGSWVAAATEGTAFILQELCLDPNEFTEGRYPDVRAVRGAVSHVVRKRRDTGVQDRIGLMVREHFDRFDRIVSDMGVLPGLGGRFRQCLLPGEGA